MEKGNEAKTVVPALRFPEFRECESWDKKNIDSILDCDSSQLVLSKLNFVNDGYPVYGADGIIGYIPNYKKDQVYISIVKDGSGVGRLNICSAYSSLLGTLNYLVSKNEQEYKIRWIYYLLQTIDFSNYIKGSGIPHIYFNDYKKQKIYISCPLEQQKIVDCLSSLDELIEATNRKIEALKEHKKGLMQRLFPKEGENVPELSFSEFQGVKKWKRKIIQDICNITTGNKNTQDKKENGIYPFFVRSPKVERIDSWSFDGEAILTAGDGVGVGKIFHYYVGKMGVHQRVYLLYDIQCNSKYLYYFFSEFFYERVKKMSAKNSVDSVRKEMISDMPLLLPSSQEQQKIADCLSSLDELIEATSQKIEILKKHKRGLMQQLFPKI